MSPTLKMIMAKQLPWKQSGGFIMVNLLSVPSYDGGCLASIYLAFLCPSTTYAGSGSMVIKEIYITILCCDNRSMHDPYR